MRNTDRRRRHKEQLKQAILETASELILNEGYPALTIRRIAEAIEYTVPTIYEHFSSKEAILQELQQHWTNDLFKIVHDVYVLGLAPEQSLKQCAEEYCKYALKHPTIYKTVMGMEGSSCDQKEAIQTIRTYIKEWITKIEKKPIDLDNAVDTYRSFLHGIASLYLINKFKGSKQHLLAIVQEFVEGLLFVWRNK